MSEIASPAQAITSQEADITAALGTRSVVLVGMMGAGKSTIGRRLAARLRLPFLDADTEIEAAAGMSIPDIFETHGEPHFRDGEARVIARLLDSGPACSPPAAALSCARRPATVFADKAVSIWLKADVDTIMRRVRRRADRPLLQTADPVATVERLVGEREPFYQAADLTIWSREVPHEKIVDECIEALHVRLCGELAGAPTSDTMDATSMTAPLKHSASITVDVALGDRAYDIVIGRDVLPSLGARIAALAARRAHRHRHRSHGGKALAGADRGRADGGRHRDIADHRR